MRIILVDNDPLIAASFEKQLNTIGGLEIVGKYTNPHLALEAVLRDRPDAIFLDTELPNLNGIEVAKRIKTSLPQIKIVFFSACAKYAVKAFELNAVDYLLKPVQQNRLIETIRRLNNVDSQFAARVQMLCCFQSLHLKWSDDGSKVDIRWRISKARELFAYLVQYRQKRIRKDVILDQFWPEVDLNKGFTQLYTTIYQIRKTLESINLNIKILSHENSYMLDLNGTMLDVDEWEKGLNSLPPISNNTLSKHLKLLDLYSGDYLSEFDDLWVESERERLRTLWLRHVSKVTDYLVSKSQYTEAIVLYHRVQELYPHAEDSYFMLMQLYDRLGDRYSVNMQYKNLQKVLAEEFEAEPKLSVQALCQKRNVKSFTDLARQKNHG